MLWTWNVANLGIFRNSFRSGNEFSEILASCTHLLLTSYDEGATRLDDPEAATLAIVTPQDFRTLFEEQ